MKKDTLLFIFSVLLSMNGLFAQTLDERQEITENYNLEKLSLLEQEYALQFAANKQEALELALINGWEEFIILPNGGIAELFGVFESGEPFYLGTDNREAGITTRTDKVHTGGGAGLELNGENMIGGIWDGGRVRETHLLLEERVDQIDGIPGISNHATHVAGTMIGTGAVVAGAAKGMAPMAELWAYNFNNDNSEMAAAAANGLLVSNHSYGADIFNVPLWYIGYYDSSARNVDDIIYNAPHYLPVKSAGNDNDLGVNPGDGGYDLLTDASLSKNNIVVAAVFEVLNYTGPNSVNIASFSSWGPTDDGRIKPDVSAKGVFTFSSTGTSNNAYATFSGTSMSTPNTSGSLLLLQQHYNNINGEFMLASTLRGLALHTADEAGLDPGPDYRFGWGLLNIEKAAEVITNEGTASLILEEELRYGEIYSTSVQADGITDFMSSLTWTDPPGNLLPTGIVDVDTPSLINDLDLGISQDGGSTFFPWKLDHTNFSAAATNGDNIVDNIEKTEISGASGEYIIQISHKDMLTNSSQMFSLISTGIDREEFYVSSHDGIIKTCPEAGSVIFDVDLSFSDGFSDTIDFTFSDLPAGTSGSFSPTSLNAEGSVELTVSGIGSLALGDYQFKVTATGSSETINIYLILSIVDDLNFSQLELLLPGNNWQNRPIDLTFEWEEGIVFIEEYDFELALDEAFTNIVVSETVVENTIDVFGLEYETEYFWRVRGTNSCENGPFSEIFSFTTMAELGINDFAIEGLLVYPNPANNILNIEASKPISFIEIYNVLGQKLISQSASNDKVQVDISVLSNGSYFVRITSESNSSVKQIIKQ